MSQIYIFNKSVSFSSTRSITECQYLMGDELLHKFDMLQQATLGVYHFYVDEVSINSIYIIYKDNPGFQQVSIHT